MSERAEGLRREAARCLAQARIAANDASRNELVGMAVRFHELAMSAQGDFDTILQGFNDAQMAHAPHVVQQQQQVQTCTPRSGKTNPAPSR
jgi:hypothetical protein